MQMSLTLPKKITRKNVASQTAKKFTVASLFSGCGGLDLGFMGGFKYRKLNFPKTIFEVGFSNDFDIDAVTTYKANKKYFNHSCVHADIRDIDEDDLPFFDILIAGFPCQPFSNAGKRQGIHDEDGRGTLFYECERILKGAIKRGAKHKPKAFVFENVRGILSSHMPNGKSVPDEIVRRMARMGYSTSFKLIKSSDYGVPQNRYRVIFVGVDDSLPKFDFKLLDDVVRDFSLPSCKKNNYDLLLGSILSDIKPNSTGVDEFWKMSPSGQFMIDNIGPTPDGEEALNKFLDKIPLEAISPTIEEGRSWKNMNPSIMSNRFKKIWDNPEKYRAPNFYRRFALGEICGTITASGQPENSGIIHPYLNRRFTIREIARIQSFPDDFIFPLPSISNKYKVIGNAVPPVMGWVIAKALETFLLKNA
jgi:DNA (cytosine-5)-methyltransferase 1